MLHLSADAVPAFPPLKMSSHLPQDKLLHFLQLPGLRLQMLFLPPVHHFARILAVPAKSEYSPGAAHILLAYGTRPAPAESFLFLHDLLSFFRCPCLPVSCFSPGVSANIKYSLKNLMISQDIL